MREILFRGKPTNNGKWVFGCYYKQLEFYGDACNDHIIITSHEDLSFDQELDYFVVQPETVGQFTGLTDKNGKKVFEGDIFHLEDEIVGVIIFKDGCFRIETYGLRGAFMEYGFDECAGGWGLIDCEPIDWSNIYDMEIIGNIHDNPKLMEGCAVDG